MRKKTLVWEKGTVPVATHFFFNDLPPPSACTLPLFTTVPFTPRKLPLVVSAFLPSADHDARNVQSNTDHVINPYSCLGLFLGAYSFLRQDGLLTRPQGDPLINACITGPLIQVCITAPLIQVCITAPLVQVCIIAPLIQVCITAPLIQVCITAPLIQVCITAPLIQVCITAPLIQVCITGIQVCIAGPLIQVCITAPLIQVCITGPLIQVCITSSQSALILTPFTRNKNLLRKKSTTAAFVSANEKSETDLSIVRRRDRAGAQSLPPSITRL